MSSKYDDSVRSEAVKEVHRCMRKLRELWSGVTITCDYTDSEGCEGTYELTSPDPDEDDDSETPSKPQPEAVSA